MKITTKINPEIEETSIDICAKSKEDLKSVMEVINSIDDTIPGKIDDQISNLQIRDILYFESVDKKTFACTLKNVYEISKWLNEIDEMMPKTFFRCSKSTIINLTKVKSFSPSFGSKIIMNLINGEKIFVSRKYVNQLYEKLKGVN